MPVHLIVSADRPSAPAHLPYKRAIDLDPKRIVGRVILPNAKVAIVNDDADRLSHHCISPQPRPTTSPFAPAVKSRQWTQPPGQSKPQSRTLGPVKKSEMQG